MITADTTTGQLWSQRFTDRLYRTYTTGNRVYFSTLGDPMNYDNKGQSEGTLETPVQQELRSLKFDVQAAQLTIKTQQERLRIARAKLAAVKALVK